MHTRTERRCSPDFEQPQILIQTLILGTHDPLLELKPNHRRYNRARPDVNIIPDFANLNVFYRTAGAPPRKADYTPLMLPIRPPSTIPMLRPEFFQSNFWDQFHAQSKSRIILSFHDVKLTRKTPLRPVPLLEPKVFLSRLEESLNGITDSLDVPGRLVAMCLVVWAVSFGHNEEGRMDQSFYPDGWRLSVKSLTNNMVKELLYLIDSYGITRKPTWDGVVVLLTILPLTKGNATSKQGFRISLTRRLRDNF